MLNYQICVYMPYLYTHNVVKMVGPSFKMAAKISQFTIKMLFFEADILYTSMEFNGVIDMCLIIKFVLRYTLFQFQPI